MQKNYIKTKKTSQSKVYFSHATLPTDLNEGGSVYGARLLEWADNLSALVAIKHRRGGVTTASFDSFDFVEPIHLGDFIFGEAFISGVSKKSMEIFVKFMGEDSKTGKKYVAAFGFITYAALNLLDGEEVPNIEAETEEEKLIMKDYPIRKKLVIDKISRNKNLINIIKE